MRRDWDRPIASAKLEAGTQALAVRRLTVTVVDRNREPWRGVWWLGIHFAGSVDALPSSGQTLGTVTKGQILSALVSNQAVLALTGPDGQFVVDVSASAVTRYPHIAVLGGGVSVGSVTWT